MEQVLQALELSREELLVLSVIKELDLGEMDLQATIEVLHCELVEEWDGENFTTEVHEHLVDYFNNVFVPHVTSC